jgi:hypothetical protein
MSWIDWIEHHLLPCPSKALFGLDCPGCGMQRSAIELLKGNFTESFKMYPALLPILLTFVLLALHLRYKFRNGTKTIQYAYIFSMIVVVTSYVIKQVQFFNQ